MKYFYLAILLIQFACMATAFKAKPTCACDKTEPYRCECQKCNCSNEDQEQKMSTEKEICQVEQHDCEECSCHCYELTAEHCDCCEAGLCNCDECEICEEITLDK